MEVDALSVLLDERRGDHEGALDRLEALVLAAEPEGWVRLFADLGYRMASLLRELAARGVAPETIRRILGACTDHDVDNASPAQHFLIEALSEREIEVLRLLAQRYSNKEIAAQLFIAPSTVKRHTLHIYRKLEANDRREAVSRAAELGLLPTG